MLEICVMLNIEARLYIRQVIWLVLAALEFITYGLCRRSAGSDSGYSKYLLSVAPGAGLLLFSTFSARLPVRPAQQWQHSRNTVSSAEIVHCNRQVRLLLRCSGRLFVKPDVLRRTAVSQEAELQRFLSDRVFPLPAVQALPVSLTSGLDC